MHFIDLQAQRARLGEPLNQAIAQAVASGQWILGPPVKELESQLAKFAGVKHVVACPNSTHALHLPLMAWGIGPGDAVFVPAFTFAATAEVVALVGASPVFVDVREDTFNMDADSLKAAIAMVKREGKLTPRAVMPVDLFGQPADYRALEPIIRAEKLLVLCDTAQGFGATLDGRVTGSIGDCAGTSFFPAKSLGCYGDGGAIFTNDDELITTLPSLHVHGQGADRYDNVRVGLNSRLDTIQAAVLLEKLKIYTDEIETRDTIASAYNEKLGNLKPVIVPPITKGARSVWAQYTLRVEKRDALQAALKEQGIPSMVYYHRPVALQKAYAEYPRGPVPISEKLGAEVISLPMHPYLTDEQQDRIVAAIR